MTRDKRRGDQRTTDMTLCLRGLSILLILAVSWMAAAPAFPAQAQEDDWSQPVNLSYSGSASEPIILGDGKGLLQAFWWDTFEGLMTSINKDGTWSQAYSAAIPNRILPAMPALKLDATGWVHAFWIDTTRNNLLFHSQMKIGSRSWEDSELLANSVHSFDVSASSTGSLSLAYLNIDPKLDEKAGIYLLYRAQGGYGWRYQAPTITSRYFRNSEPGKKYFRVLDGGDGSVYLVWEDLRTGQYAYSYSFDQGRSWAEQQAVDPLIEPLEGGVRLPSLAETPTSEILLIGASSPGSACDPFQERFLFHTEKGAWSLPTDVLQEMSSCPENGQFFTAEGQFYSIWGAGSDTLYFSRMDLNTRQWSLPHPLSLRVTDPDTNRTLQLGELGAYVSAAQVVLVGKDGSGDVWVTESPIDAFSFPQSSQSPWAAPSHLTLNAPVDGKPVLTVDAEANTHIVWSQASDQYSAGTALYYARWMSAANTLSHPVEVVQSAGNDIAHQPALTFSAEGWLHLAWSGGEEGQLFYARALPREAASQGGWSPPRSISVNGLSADPQLAADAFQGVYLLYTIPVNENRGVYLLRSSNSGKDWSEPIQIYNAAAHNWLRVDHPTLALAPDGTLYAAWVKNSSLDALSPREIDISSSQDYGLTWSEPFAVAGEGFSWPQLVPNAGGMHLFYASTSGIVYQRSLEASGESEAAAWSQPFTMMGVQDLLLSKSLAPYSVASDGGPENGSLHITGATASGAIFYSQWNGERWQTDDPYPFAAAGSPSGGIAAAAAPQGGSLSIAWVAVGEEAQAANPYASLAKRTGELYFLRRQIPTQEVAAVTPRPSATPAETRKPALTLATPFETPVPSATASVDRPSQSTSSLPPLLLGGALAGTILAVILSAKVTLRLRK